MWLVLARPAQVRQAVRLAEIHIDCGEKMITKPSQLLSALAWISVFCEAWLLLTRHIPSDFLSWGLWLFFLVIALMASLASIDKVSR
jgi:hypothetical protein